MSGTEQVLYANVIVDISHEKLDKIFQYRVPDVLRMQIHPGTAVTVPFGNGNRRIQGYVVKLTDYPPEKIKEIQGVCAGQTGVEGKLIALAAWMRDYYGSTMIQALKAVLPVKQKVAQKEQKQIRLLLPEKEAREMLQVQEKKNTDIREKVFQAFAQNHQPLLKLNPLQVSLEDVFMELTQSDRAAEEYAEKAKKKETEDMKDAGDL